MRLIVVLLAVITCTIAQPPAGFLDRGHGRLMNLLSPYVVSRRSAEPQDQPYTVPRLLNDHRYSPTFPKFPYTYDWLSREINRIRLMNDATRKFGRILVLPDELIESNIEDDDIPLYRERLKQLTYYESGVADENEPQNSDRENIPSNENVKSIEKFAYTPSEPKFFHNREHFMHDIQKTLPITTPNPNVSPHPDDFEERRQTRQNPNLSRSKSLLNHDFDKYMLRMREKSKQETEVPSQVQQDPTHLDPTESIYGVAVLAAIGAALTVAVVAFGFGWYTLSQKAKLAADVDYPAYGVTGPTIDTSGDRKLAQSAHMYHYQHQKQQIMALERNSGVDQRHGSISEPESEEENEGDYTVYEYPGFATSGDMVVKNPIFSDDPTPATPAKTEENKEQKD